MTNAGMDNRAQRAAVVACFIVLACGCGSADSGTQGTNIFNIDDATGNIGIGTDRPLNKLQVEGKVDVDAFRMASGARSGDVLMCDAFGNGTWQAAPGGGGGSDGDWVVTGNDMYSGLSGKVGIGTTSPGSKLEIVDSAHWSAAPGVLEVTNNDPTGGIGVYASASGDDGIALRGVASGSGTGAFGATGSGGMARYSSAALSTFADQSAVRFSSSCLLQASCETR